MSAIRIASPFAVLGLLLLSGCMGHPDPYRPGWEERPPLVALESAEDEARRLTVPLEIVRNDSYLKVGKKEIARMLGEVPKNVWWNYEDDFDAALGTDRRTGETVAENYLKRPGYYLALRKITAERKAKEEEPDDEADGDDGGDGGDGGDDEDWDEDDEDDDDEDWDDE